MQMVPVELKDCLFDIWMELALLYYSPSIEFVISFNLLVANLADIKWCKKNWKMIETLANGYSSESTR